MVFNLTTHASFPCENSSEAIYCSKAAGPSFGWHELAAWYEPFNKYGACISWTNPDGYNIPLNEEGINVFKNQQVFNYTRHHFTISELEVWGVTFNE
jgi:hypothetical protein